MEEHDALQGELLLVTWDAAARDVYCKRANEAAGEYLVFEFEPSFTNAPGVIETVTLMLDKDGKWKVSGYFVKRAGGQRFGKPVGLRERNPISTW